MTKTKKEIKYIARDLLVVGNADLRSLQDVITER